jgi:hypothetical protein
MAVGIQTLAAALPVSLGGSGVAVAAADRIAMRLAHDLLLRTSKRTDAARLGIM